MDQEKFRELCFLYLLNQLEGEEYAEFENALVHGGNEYREIYQRIKSIVFYLPLAVETKKVSPKVKERLLAKINENTTVIKEDYLIKNEGVRPFKSYLAAAAIVLLLITGVLLIYTLNLNKTIDSQEAQITELKTELDRNKELLSILQSRRIEVVIMDGLEVNPAGYGKIIWDPERKSAILQISNLPATAKDKSYQLWLIKDSKPISAGVFRADAPKENFYRIDNLAEADKKDISAFAVTLEPYGGVPQPTGQMYLLGKTEL